MKSSPWSIVALQSRTDIVFGKPKRIPLDIDVSEKVLSDPSTETVMRIQEAADRLGVSTRVLRHYEHEGLIVPRRTPNGYRSYSAPEVDRAAWVRDLIGSGFSTREIRNLIAALEDGTSRLGVNCSAVMKDKLERIDRAIETLRRRRRTLSRRLSDWRQRPRDQ
ncbi:MerR family transcriptional regulator [Bradyrhizobium uaiense]